MIARRRALVTGSLGLASIAAIALVACAALDWWSDRAFRAKVARARADAREIVMGFYMGSDWCCIEYRPGADNSVPPRTAASMKRVPSDPFSSQDGYRVLTPFGAGGGFAVVSRGPDGAWDIDRLPRRLDIHLPPADCRGDAESWPVVNIITLPIFATPTWMFAERESEDYDDIVARAEAVAGAGAAPPTPVRRTDIERYLSENGVRLVDETLGRDQPGDVVTFVDF